MKLTRNLTLAAVAVSCAVALTACKPIDKDGGDAKADAKADATAEAGKDGAIKVAGLPTEMDQVSYLIGMDIGKSLKPMKDDIKMDKLQRGLDDALADKKSLLTEEQTMQVMQAFATKMQAKQQEEMAKQQAKMAEEGKKNLEAGAKFLAENGKKPGVVTTASGLQYTIVSEGKGPKPKDSDLVKVRYTGTLIDGKKFDSSYDRGDEPAQFAVNGVVPGWTEALQLMPVGSKFKLWIPAALGYGEQGTPGGPIPPNATLIFDVELVEIAKP